MRGADLSDGQNGSALQNFSYAMIFILNVPVFFFNTVVFNRASTKFPDAMGALKGLNATIITLSIVILFFVGGIMSATSPPSPLLFGLILLGISVIFDIVMAFTRQLHI
jgi:hypothetical protein